MSDWRQIQARIRKARTSPDPPGQLAALYERTHDAMVAFELAQIHEKSGTHAEAAHWYTAAAERFRRAQWKQKAEEALTRLGAPIPVAPVVVAADEISAEPFAGSGPIITEFSEQQVSEIAIVPGATEHESALEQPSSAQPLSGEAAPVRAAEDATGRRRKRRGRRGGRGRNKGLRAGVPVAGSPTSVAPHIQAAPSLLGHVAEPRTELRAAPVVSMPASPDFAASASREPETPGSPSTNFEHAAHSGIGSSLQMRTRAGDPALSSRMSKLESQLRRLLACSLHSVDQPDDAPAGPGVFLITDTDQTCYYYIEACQTLRVGIGNLLRTGRNSREGADLKEKLADHLGINESRVGKYLKENCVVRWLQLDEGAPLLSHFAIAVLRPIANE